LSIGKFDTPPPMVPLRSEDIKRWAQQLIAWLRSEESDPVDTLEDDFVFGGASVANRLFGFEDVEVDPAGADKFTILAAPVAGKKKIITDLIIAADGLMSFRLFKDKDGTEHDMIPEGSVDSAISYNHPGNIVLDADDETLQIEVLANAGDDDLFWNGNYLDVD